MRKVLIATYFTTTFISALGLKVKAQQCSSTGSGNWGNTSKWSCDGINRLPTCGDTVVINSGHEITVNTQYNFTSCTSSMVVEVLGTFSFTNGNKVELPCGSLLSVHAGGVVRKTTSGGGSSTLVSICGTTIWSAESGPLWGPVSFGGFILPVELLEFVAVQVEDEVLVSWQTASEVNNDYFTLYQSKDGEHWTLMHQQTGMGNSSQEQRYEHILYNQDPISTYYRLDQTDFDGLTKTVAFSKASVTPKRVEGMLLYPNPTMGQTTLEFADAINIKHIALFDMAGKELKSWVTSTNLFHFDPHSIGIVEGIYLLTVNDGYTIQQVKMEVKN